MANYNDNARNFFDAPEWIEDSLTLGDIPEISTHGCASGVYMPAVTYYEARRTMWQCGDDITDFIGEHADIGCAEILQNASADTDYSSMCCALVSYAVELWCHMNCEEAQQKLAAEDSDED